MTFGTLTYPNRARSKYCQEATEKSHESGTILLNNACREVEEARADLQLGDKSLDSIAGGDWGDKKRDLAAKSVKVFDHREDEGEEMSDEMTPLMHGLKITNFDDYVTDLATITVDNDDVEEECVIEYGSSPDLLYVHLLGKISYFFINVYIDVLIFLFIF